MRNLLKKLSPLFQALLLQLFFLGLDYVGVHNPLLQSLVLLIATWILLMFFDIIFLGILRGGYIAEFFLDFTRCLPMMFPAFFISGLITSIFINPALKNLLDVPYIVFWLTYVAILFFQDYQYLLVEKLVANQRIASWIEKSITYEGQGLVTYLANAKNQSPKDYRIALDNASSFLLMITGFTSSFIIVIFGVLPLQFITGDANASPLLKPLVEIIFLFAALMAIGGLQQFYIHRLISIKYYLLRS